MKKIFKVSTLLLVTAIMLASCSKNAKKDTAGTLLIKGAGYVFLCKHIRSQAHSSRRKHKTAFPYYIDLLYRPRHCPLLR